MFNENKDIKQFNNNIDVQDAFVPSLMHKCCLLWLGMLWLLLSMNNACADN